MNARPLAYSLAALTALAAGVLHWNARRDQMAVEAETSHVMVETAQTRLLIAETSRQLATLTAEREKRADAAAASSKPPAENPVATSKPKPAVTPLTSEVREMRVQAFVSDLRLSFAALFKQLGFTPEKLQAFDGIEGECQRILQDASVGTAVREQARQTRDIQLKDFFGPAYGQWQEANRTQPARAIVAEIVQQTFQGSGALTTTQADQLTTLVDRNRVPASSGPASYNWDQIVAEAPAILADGQMADFAAAARFRRVTDDMAAIIRHTAENMSASAAKKKP